jgi:hypothetical protein
MTRISAADESKGERVGALGGGGNELVDGATEEPANPTFGAPDWKLDAYQSGFCVAVGGGYIQSFG